MAMWIIFKSFSGLRSPLTLWVMKLGDVAGSGVGAGGGTGGAVRDAGGAMGKRGVVMEEQYFRKKEQEQLKQLRAKLRESNHVVGETALNAYLDSITSHEEHIREHQQEAAFHRDIILTHQDKVQYHEQQIVKHQDAISTLTRQDSLTRCITPIRTSPS
nr:ATPase inhibitor, mitochondrial-like isoform X1 [Cherax quadricarinatus]